MLFFLVGMVIKRIAKLLGRRSKRSLKAEPAPAPVPVPAPQRALARSQNAFTTWESELRAIAAEAAAWSIETGGDLFGRWTGSPVIFLATKAGPKAQRDNAHFRLDVDYLRQLSEPLAEDWNLRYFGDWHSHHRLGLSEPSSGDKRRIRQLGARNSFAGMAEIIVTTEGSQDRPIVRVHPWLYDLTNEDEPTALSFRVLPGCSPIRQALIAANALPEQALRGWESVPLDRVRLSRETAPPQVEATSDVDLMTREKAMARFVNALRDASGAPIEVHSAAFGNIVVAALNEPLHLAFAIDSKWPLSVLEVHRLDRNSGSTEPIDLVDGLTALDVQKAIEVFHAAKNEQRA
ncbi:hypothetical protein [Bradyrhizobium niftali]|uniref:JAB domain-containing protein n=1 Tax=Bradyrhizobium niftali TaxID=2560055 RepID=A0A4Y9LZM2_9BRAD|nr:hypothetical protein [Bradyrhizobium niftali]TFV48277.1 hypothetical protein E4K65_12740 [Bradyrhizobium niftali]